MGILSNALGGLGQGLAAVGKDQLEYADRSDLLNQQSQLEMQRQQALMEAKMAMAQKQRTQMAGDIDNSIINNAKQTFNPDEDGDLSTYTQSQLGDMTARRDAAARLGYVDEASQFGKMANDDATADKPVSVPFGATLTDQEGNVLYDGSSMLKKEIEQGKLDQKNQMMLLRQAALQEKQANNIKERNQQIDAIHKTIKEDYGDKTDPFMPMGDDGKPSKDKAYLATLANAASDVAEARQKSGVMPSTYQTINAVKPLLDHYDDTVQQTGKGIADILFDDKGRMKNDAVAKNFAQMGFDIQSKDTFLRTFRNSYLSQQKFQTYAKNPQQGDQQIEGLLKGLVQQKPQPQGRGILRSIIDGVDSFVHPQPQQPDEVGP